MLVFADMWPKVCVRFVKRSGRRIKTRQYHQKVLLLNAHRCVYLFNAFIKGNGTLNGALASTSLPLKGTLVIKGLAIMIQTLLVYKVYALEIRRGEDWSHAV